MKKILAILLMTVYTAASSGTVMSAHFCMGELAGLSIGENQQEQCGYCGMQDAGCCHDELQIVKIDGSQLVKVTTVSLDNKFSPYTRIIIFPRQRSFDGGKQRIIYSFSPFSEGPPIFIQNCVFRI